MLDKFPDAYFIINRDYLDPDPNRWELKVEGPYKNPKDLHVERCKVLDRFEDIFDCGIEVIPSKILEAAVYQEIQDLKDSLLNSMKEENIDEAITCCNNKSLEEACEEFNIPCVHTEQGPLRPPFFKRTAYFDFSGVNGNTEFLERFMKFEGIADKVDILSREELLEVVCLNKEKLKEVKELSRRSPVYQCGVALQVDVDTNLIAYNRGITQADLLNMAIRNNGEVLVRNHPLSTLGYLSNASLGPSTLDKSKNSLEFISKCKSVWSINSSVGFEALLMGRRISFKGETPFRYLQYMNDEELLIALNFAVFSYLIPGKVFEDEEYHKFRIKNKDELELYKYGQKLWLGE